MLSGERSDPANFGGWVGGGGEGVQTTNPLCYNYQKKTGKIAKVKLTCGRGHYIHVLHNTEYLACLAWIFI